MDADSLQLKARVGQKPRFISPIRPPYLIWAALQGRAIHGSACDIAEVAHKDIDLVYLV